MMSLSLTESLLKNGALWTSYPANDLDKNIREVWLVQKVKVRRDGIKTQFSVRFLVISSLSNQPHEVVGHFLTDQGPSYSTDGGIGKGWPYGNYSTTGPMDMDPSYSKTNSPG